MLRNLTVSVLRYEKLRTTEAKGKEIRRFVDRMIGLGREGTLSARRRALAWLPEPQIVEKVFGDLAQRYPERTSGYLRITPVGPRVGDSAPMVQLELVEAAEEAVAEEERSAEEAKPRARGILRRRSPKRPSA